ncbi:immunoglobulin-like and fibronectin type III domain-containing protein 1 [Branchiostoma floridae x Branchiostoma japonicum]
MSAFGGLGRPDDQRRRHVQPGENLSETENPRAPDRLEAVETTTDGIKLQWTPVESNRLYGYLLERSTAFENTWTSVHSPKPVLRPRITNFTVDKVKPYESYDFCVKSAVTNNEGDLLCSDPGCKLQNVVAKEQYQPYPPRGFKVEDITEESVSLIWKEPLPDDDYDTPVSYEYIIEMCDYADGNIHNRWQEYCRTETLQCTVKVTHNGICRFRVTTHNRDKDISSLRLELSKKQLLLQEIRQLLAPLQYNLV